MGVKGLWRLLLPIGRRISIETLEGKILAIDASIWLTQFLKAMRDPDSGRVQAAAHLIGFFRRICRLRFHGIKPVFVFDGATPEIKKREVLLRRRRREQFATLGDATVQRMARRLLAETLKKQKVKALPPNDAKERKSNKTAFAEGFNPGAQEEVGEKEEADPSASPKVDRLEEELSDTETQVDPVQVTNKKANDERRESQIDVDYEIALSEQKAEDVNDWDLPLPDHRQGEDTTSSNGSDDDISARDWRVSDPDNIAQIFQLPANKRKDAIEHAKRQQRLQSRKEFMPAAGNPIQFSQVQLTNFLRSTRLNRSIAKMAIESVKKDNQGLRGELMASDRTTRVELLREEDDDEDAESTTYNRENLAQRRRKRSRRGSEPSSSDEAWSVHDEVNAKNNGHPSSPREKHVASRKRRNVIDDSDSSVDTFSEKPETASPPGSRSNDEAKMISHIVFRHDNDEDSESEGGGFIKEDTQQSAESSKSVLEASNSLSKQNIVRSDEAVGEINGCKDSDSEGGGFMKQPLGNDLRSSKADVSSNPQGNHEFSDRMLAERMQMMEYDQGTTQRGNIERIVKSNEHVYVVDLTADPMNSQTLNEAAKASSKEEDNSVGSVDEEEDVDWEDGADEIEDDHEATKVEQDFEKEREDETDELNPLDSGWGKVQYSGDSLSHETQEALERAQATASKLADWAGRVFKRAMKDASGPVMKKQKPSSNDRDENNSETNTLNSSNEHERNEKVITHVDQNSYDDEDESDSMDVLDLTDLHASIRQKDVDSSTNTQQTTKATTSQRSISFSNVERLEAFLDNVHEDESKWEEERRKRERDMDTVTDDMREEAIRLLQLFGVPYVEAPAEAEAQCAALEELGLVDGIVTEDSDIFVFGGQTVFKNIFDEQKYAEVYKACDAQREMSLSRNHMVALAMLLGGDYTQGVKGVGIVNAMEIFEAFDVSGDLKAGLGEFKSWLDGFDPFEHSGHEKIVSSKRAIFCEKHKSGRNRWIAPEGFPSENVLRAYLHPVVDTSSERFSWGVPDVDNLLAFCTKNIGWRPDDTMRLLEPVLEKLATRGMRQTRIDAFMRYEDTIKFADVRSQRLREVLKSKNNQETT